MTRVLSLLLSALLAATLAACTVGGGGTADPTPLAADAISVTALPPVAGAPVEGDGAAPEVAAAEDTVSAGEATAAERAGDDTTGDPADAEVPPSEIPENAAPPLPEPPPPTPEALACGKRGGQYVGTGAGTLKACVKPTGEGTRRCTKESDCKGVCLARSGTCSPVTPLFGCNDILQADGRRVTLCID